MASSSALNMATTKTDIHRIINAKGRKAADEAKQRLRLRYQLDFGDE
jgi:hypothetical protein